MIQQNLFNNDQPTDVNLGPTAGIGFNLPLHANDESERPDEEKAATSKIKERNVSVNYSYRATNAFFGTHTIGLNLAF